MYITPVHAMGIAIIFLTLSPVKAYTQKDSLYLSVDQLFEKGIKQNLQLPQTNYKSEWLKNAPGQHV